MILLKCKYPVETFINNHDMNNPTPFSCHWRDRYLYYITVFVRYIRRMKNVLFETIVSCLLFPKAAPETFASTLDLDIELLKVQYLFDVQKNNRSLGKLAYLPFL